MTKPRTKAEEALQFLDDLDNLSPVPPSANPEGATAGPAAARAITGGKGVGAQRNKDDPADVLNFIDEITRKSSEPTRPASVPLDRPASRAGGTATPVGTLRKATERVRVGSPVPPSTAGSMRSTAGAGAPPSRSDSPAQVPSSPEMVSSASAQISSKSTSGWGWSNVWSSASAAIQQAKSAVDEGVKHLPGNEQATKWREDMMGLVPKGLNKEQLEKLGNDLRSVGYSTLTEIINAVAPPISEHEVIQVWTSHDLEGYIGVESLVYRALARIMEQVEGGDLIVNKGHEPKSREKSSQRNMNVVDGIETAFKLAEANVEELIKSNPNKNSPPLPSQIPTTYSSVYLRIQPFYTTIPSVSNITKSHLQFMLCMSDPSHQLQHTTVTQVVPIKWLEYWNTQDWVEDAVVEALQTGVETIGQEYIASRMGWMKDDEANDEFDANGEDSK